MLIRNTLWGPALAFGLVACAAADADDGDSKSALKDCKPNQTLVCTCGIDKGSQTCSKKKELSACDCTSTGKQKAEEVEREARSSSLIQEDKKDESEDLEPTPPKNPITDAGTKLPAGPTCQALSTCCRALENAGFIGNANQCDRTVAEGDEFDCYTLYEREKQPDPEGLTDFVCY
jgi:hypothetical protein